MSTFPYNVLTNELDTFTSADLIAQMGSTERTLYGPPPFSWASQAFFARGRVAHGSSCPSAFLAGMTAVDSSGMPLCQDMYWNAFAPWVVAIAESDNTCTNAYIKISKIRCYILSLRTGLWSRFGSQGNGYPSGGLTKYKYDYSTSYGGATVIYDFDGAPCFYPWHTVGPEQIMLHSSIMAKGAIDGEDYGGCFVVCESQLVAPIGSTFDATPRYALSVGADLYPDINTSVNAGVIAGQTYVPGVGGSAFRSIPTDGTPMLHYFITTNNAGVTTTNGTSVYEDVNGATSMYMSNAELAANMPVLTPNLNIVQAASVPATVAIDISLAGGATQPREGSAVLSIDFTTGTPTEVTITRNDNHTFSVWPSGALSQYFTPVTGGLEFDLSLAHMNLGLNAVSARAIYADDQSTTARLIITIEAVVDPTPTEIAVSMLGGLNQTRQGRDIFQIDFTEGTPVSVVFARNDNATFAQWPTGNLSAYFTEVPNGLEFDLELTSLNLGSNTLAVSATYSDASTATDSLSLVLTEIDAGAVTLGPLPWVATPLASATMFASPTGNDANPGTFASPKTFQGAITAATAGSVIFLRGGTYPVTDSAHIQAWAEGTAGAPIIFESYPDELAIIDGSGMTPWVGNKRINVSGQYQKFRGLRITGFPENGFLVGTGSHHTTIDGCEIDNCHLSGIMNFNSSDNRYINCYVHDCSDVGGAANGGNADGISVASGSRNYVGNCLVENCSDDGIDSWQSQDTVFEFNIVRGCGLGDGNGNGFKCGGADIGANAMVNNNLAYNNRALGFDVNTGINVTFKNNTSYNNDAQGYGLESDTIAINNVSSGDGSIKYGTGIPTNNSWNIGGTLTFISTTEGNANFLKVTQGGSFDGIGWEYI